MKLSGPFLQKNCCLTAFHCSRISNRSSPTWNYRLTSIRRWIFLMSSIVMMYLSSFHLGRGRRSIRRRTLQQTIGPKSISYYQRSSNGRWFCRRWKMMTIWTNLMSVRRLR
jgi:hypothetical protein